MARPAYLDDTRAAELARLIKDGAIFIRPEGSTPPSGLTWVPTTEDKKSVVGYYSEDGQELTPVPGDSEDLLGHNGDVLVSEQAPGWWTIKFSGLEGRQTVTCTYFDVDPEALGADGSITIDKASNSTRYDLVCVGLDQKERLIILHFPSVQISEKDAIVFNRTTLTALGMTFRTFKGGSAAPYQIRAWGLINEEETSGEG